MRPIDSRAVKLLTRILASGVFDVPRIASELVTDERTVGRYLSGELPLPVEQQLCLAQFLIENVPELSRQGRNLLGQIKAEMLYNQGDVSRHSSAPHLRF